jgi:hypothetical protein
MDTTGSSPEQGSQSTTAPDDWVQNPYVQIEGGFLAGLAEGFVPFGGVGHQILDLGEVIPHGSPQARFGLAFGQVLGGVVTLLGGITGEVLGGIATTTGIGAAVGVPTIVVSTTFAFGGFANIAAGLSGLPQATPSSSWSTVRLMSRNESMRPAATWMTPSPVAAICCSQHQKPRRESPRPLRERIGNPSAGSFWSYCTSRLTTCE